MQTNIYLKEKNKYKNIPNFLTIVRIFLTPIILCFLFLAEKSEKFYSLNLSFKENEEYCSISFFHFFAGTLFVLGCLSDFLDGYLARKYKCDSNFGKLWDPIADKIMINSVLIVFAFKTYIPCYLVIINICRDIIIDGYKMFAASKNVIVAANFFGKLKTILQMIGIIVIFFFFNNKINHKEKVFYYLIQNLLIFEATIATIIAGVVYIIQINKAIAYDPTKNS